MSEHTRTLRTQRIATEGEKDREANYRPLLPAEYRLKQVCQWEAHTELVSCIKTVDVTDEKLVITGGHDKLIKIWVYKRGYSKVECGREAVRSAETGHTNRG